MTQLSLIDAIGVAIADAGQRADDATLDAVAKGIYRQSLQSLQAAQDLGEITGALLRYIGSVDACRCLEGDNTPHAASYYAVIAALENRVSPRERAIRLSSAVAAAAPHFAPTVAGHR
ncbi:MAG TPA: hypothetical protein VNF75_00020 [Candidatus Dormibacteraeota bacterium]|nr:hypothetical protein [Candidatus Dormibacteraeota bacterium]